VWVTLDGDPRDYVLEPGESFTTQEHSRALVYALERSRVSLGTTVRASRGLAAKPPLRWLHA
jgi:hypothetical protein